MKYRITHGTLPNSVCRDKNVVETTQAGYWPIVGKKW